MLRASAHKFRLNSIQRPLRNRHNLNRMPNIKRSFPQFKPSAYTHVISPSETVICDDDGLEGDGDNVTYGRLNFSGRWRRFKFLSLRLEVSQKDSNTQQSRCEYYHARQMQ